MLIVWHDDKTNSFVLIRAAEHVLPVLLYESLLLFSANQRAGSAQPIY